ncbi:MAG: hypothetical protein GXY83_29925 [Rhodopirellula sp.]|nr:hypothetical protein [Rhodopirellula sp.]
MVSVLVRHGFAGTKKWSLVLVAAVGACCVAGCGDGGVPAAVSGSVSFAGTPVENGSIRFDAIGETVSDPAAAKIEGGKYQIPTTAGLQAGSYRVIVSATQVVGKKTDPETGTEVDEVKQLIPEKYSQGEGLTAELSPGENTKDFDLQP